MKLLATTLAAIFLLLQYKLWIAPNNVMDLFQLQKEIAIQQKNNQKLQKRNKALQAEVHDLKSGHQAIEERARSELGMIRKDEVFYQIIESPPTQKIKSTKSKKHERF